MFLTCWVIYSLHFATNIVRELYPALALGDRLSFNVYEYLGLHPDIFQPDPEVDRAFINSNPGASMVAAIPYAVARPLIDRVVQAVQRHRAAHPSGVAPAYDSPWPMAQDFYRQVRERELDVKLALGAFVTQTFCMAPASALGVVGMFVLLRRLFPGGQVALWLAILYAFGTPVFFRTGTLNHNLMQGHAALAGFLALWGWDDSRTTSRRVLLAGLAGGAAVLLDYSGLVILAALLVYAVVRAARGGSTRAMAISAAVFLLGALPMLAPLWFYQWRSFGHPFYPAQHWMPPVQYVEQGYRGFGPPQLDLLGRLLFDYRYGLFVSCPLLMLALAVPWANRGRRLGRLELAFMFTLAGALWLFTGCNNYARLQFNTGIRHLAPALPFLFVPAALLLVRLPRRAALLIGVLSVALAWCMAMYRDVELGLGVADPVVRTLVGGLQLPALSTLSRMEAFAGLIPHGISPLPALLLAGAIIAVIWRPVGHPPPHDTRPGAEEPLAG